ncbi:secreted protein [Melampsora americana]|nr:secreted protein [Melampsora americana]
MSYHLKPCQNYHQISCTLTRFLYSISVNLYCIMMLAFIKGLLFLAASIYNVSARSVTAPMCKSSNSVIPGDCRSALASFLEDKNGMIIRDTPSNQKSCRACQVRIYTSRGDNIRVSGEGAREAVQLILDECNNGYGSVTIPELPNLDRSTVPTILSIEIGSGKDCDFMDVSVENIPLSPFPPS